MQYVFSDFRGRTNGVKGSKPQLHCVVVRAGVGFFFNIGEGVGTKTGKRKKKRHVLKTREL